MFADAAAERGRRIRSMRRRARRQARSLRQFMLPLL